MHLDELKPSQVKQIIHSEFRQLLKHIGFKTFDILRTNCVSRFRLSSYARAIPWPRITMILMYAAREIA